MAEYKIFLAMGFAKLGKSKEGKPWTRAVVAAIYRAEVVGRVYGRADF
jgi:hypothetical protein